MEQLAHQRGRRDRRGVALLLVLGSLVFIAALILAFLAGGGSEVKTSTTYAEGSRVALLTQTAVNLVQAELLDATKGQDAGGNDLAWATQPGMARTFDTTGALVKAYKLYSAATMVTNSVNPAADLAAMQHWYTDKAYYTDLNAPVRIGGIDRYPILDGNLSANGATYTFPAGATNIAPAGFSVNNPPLDTAPGAVSKAPLPVQWLYVLQDGTVTAPTAGGSGSTASIPGVLSGGKTNSIVGRIAFWTDDETAKVNINTASEGIYSDMPRASSAYDVALATQPPVHNEFQRYPGHPATTSLSAVFGSAAGTLLPVPAPGAITAANVSQFTPYYNLAPKVKDGGSQGGTTSSSSDISPDSDRLYASVDELMFQPNRTTQPVLNPTAVEQARFFVTAHSRAPDVNLFNKPRVGIWPVNATAASRSALDQLIAFCTTVNKIPYYFQRSDWKASDEFKLGNNRKVLAYLKTLCGKAVPGFGGTFTAKYASVSGHATEIDQILTEIFDYVRCINIYDTSSGAVPFTLKSTGSGVGGEVVPTVDTDNDTKGFGRFPTIAKAGLLFVAIRDGDVDHNLATVPADAPAANKVRVQAALVFQLFDPAEGYPGLYPQAALKVTSSTLTWDAGKMFTPPALLTTYPGNGGLIRHWSGILGAALLKNNTSANPSDQSAANWGGSGSPLFTKIDSTGASDYDKSGAGVVLASGGSITVEVSLDGTTTPVQTITINFDGGTFPLPVMPVKMDASNKPVAVTGFNDAATGKAYDSTNLNNRFAPASSSYYSDWRAKFFIITQNDTFRSMQSKTGDYRLSAARAVIGTGEAANQFAAHANYTVFANRMAHSFIETSGFPYYGCAVGQLTGFTSGYWDAGNTATTTVTPRVYNINSADYTQKTDGSGKPATSAPTLTCITPDGLPAAQKGTQAGSINNFAAGKPLSDWDNGSGNAIDGAYINKVDEGADGNPPYFDNGADWTPIKTIYFSPNRQVSSPVVFGSLPTGVIASAIASSAADLQPWQTLLFHPDASLAHRGNGFRGGTGVAAPPFTTPPDELLLDLFTMPVVEPYAISEPLSTAGRINMNYQIVPFTYVNRDTGVRAVLKSERLLAIPNANANITIGAQNKIYKQLTVSSTDYKNYGVADYRFDMNLDETMKGFQARFDANDIFRSPAEVCSLDLVPNDAGAAYSANGTTMQTYWENHRLTGDNSREKPYADIYPRLTTKSNTFTVHLRVQTLKKAGAADPDKWKEGVDLVTAEYRGSRLIERYVDPANPNIPDYTDPSQTTPLSQFYRWRVVESKQFPP